ncbi:hypothetical protein H6F88_30450 [Oculatella sp. FACHB-28]|uniref:hypothetical protein n=1 Tax=Oculatella sp. FACHB-28 TaxID=2692845 RepID=UPI001688ED7B|nr:hypothetical protein [Oculatella sp. FACHB-28]MBD2060268.1 hypothetical protein [Oculatella sp. FACHB-28]
MNLQIEGDRLKINLTFLEKLLALQFNYAFEIPLAQIEQVSTEKPSSRLQYRMPGTAIPGLFAAGTYYSDRGREFWYVTGDRHYLVLDLKDEFYQRVVLSLDQNETWAERLAGTRV